MTTQAHGDAPPGAPLNGGVDDEADLSPLGVVAAPEAGGWVVVNLTTLRVVEPGYVWPKREGAVRWARQELERERLEELEYRRSQDEPVERGLSRSWAATHPPTTGSERPS